jgi:phosphate starvation-inducible PhoH-like protein
MAEAILDNIDTEEAMVLFGKHDENLRLLREQLGVQLIARGRTLSVRGEEAQVDQGVKILDRMRARIKTKRAFSLDDVRSWLLGAALAPADGAAENRSSGPIDIVGPMRRLKSRTLGQSRYVQAIRDHDLTICIGPAGTGKTYLAVATALEAMQRQQVKRLVLVRPAVEAGERLGFLPGDMMAKVHPFVRPLLDALREMLDFHQVKKYMDEDVIEIAPLAYMRGRTLNDSFIILDEGQNTTIPQMKMFLTRMGTGSKIVVTGDVTQVDLPPGVHSGLYDAVRRLGRLERVAVVRMETSDIVRHPLVESIVKAYDDEEQTESGNGGAPPS